MTTTSTTARPCADNAKTARSPDDETADGPVFVDDTGRRRRRFRRLGRVATVLCASYVGLVAVGLTGHGPLGGVRLPVPGPLARTPDRPHGARPPAPSEGDAGAAGAAPAPEPAPPSDREDAAGGSVAIGTGGTDPAASTPTTGRPGGTPPATAVPPGTTPTTATPTAEGRVIGPANSRGTGLTLGKGPGSTQLPPTTDTTVPGNSGFGQARGNDS